jgi:hypothetical protein
VQDLKAALGLSKEFPRQVIKGLSNSDVLERTYLQCFRWMVVAPLLHQTVDRITHRTVEDHSILRCYDASRDLLVWKTFDSNKIE